MSSRLEEALGYARVGWNVFPLSPSTKRPLTRHGYHDASTDPDQIEHWWSVDPDANIGIALAPSNLCAVDFDPRNGPDQLEDLEREICPLPRNCYQATPSGGRHFFMRPVEGRRPRGKAIVLGEKYGAIDFKQNGYCLGEGSSNSEGVSYEWLALDPDDVPEVPDAWVDALYWPASDDMAAPDASSIADWQYPSDPELARDDLLRLRQDLTNLGSRASGNNTTYRAVSRIFHDYGLGVDDGWPELLAWNSGCGDPHDERELHRQMHRVALRDQLGRRGRARLGSVERPTSIGTRVARAAILPNKYVDPDPDLEDSSADAEHADEPADPDDHSRRVVHTHIAERTADPGHGPVLDKHGVDPAAIAAAIVASAADLAPSEVAPTRAELETGLKVRAKKLRASPREGQALAGNLVAQIVTGKWLPDPGEQRALSVAQAATALVALAPPGATDLQLASFLPTPNAVDAIAAARCVPVLSIAPSPARPPSGAIDPEEWGEGSWELETNGPTAGKPRASSQVNVVLALHRMGLVPRENLFSHRIAFSGPGVETVLRGDDALDDQALIYVRLEADRSFGFMPAIDFLDQVVQDLAGHNRFHPVRDYLDDAQASWDGVRRLGCSGLDGLGARSWIAEYGGADDTDYVRAVGRLMLVAAVRRIREPGVKFDEMMILESPQGHGKSTALQTLAVRDDWFTDNVPMGADPKLAMEALGAKWICEAGELKGMRRAEVAELKEFVSRSRDEARQAYGKYRETQPRQCVFFGSTNEEADYLRDPTGNRRFWPVKIDKFDLARLAADVAQLWGEAAAAEATGESIRLDPRLYQAAAVEQEKRRAIDPIEDAISEALGDVESGKIRRRDVYQVLGMQPLEVKPEVAQKITALMRRRGWSPSRRADGPLGPQIQWYVRGDVLEQERELRPAGRKIVVASVRSPT